MRPLGNKKAVNPGRWEQDLVRTMKKHQIIHLNLQMSTLICCWDFRGSEMEGSSGDGEGKRSCQKQQELCLLSCLHLNPWPQANNGDTQAGCL